MSKLSSALHKISDAELQRLYAASPSICVLSRSLRVDKNAIHRRLRRMGACRQTRWTATEDQFLRDHYSDAAIQGKVAALAKAMNRPIHGLFVRAVRLGLSKRRGVHEKPWARVWKGMTEQQARQVFEKFKQSRLGLGQYCQKLKYDDLGFSRTLRGYFPDEWEHLMEAKAPRQTKYRLGRCVEYRIRDDLKAKGYFALRSPRSGGPVDLVAIKPGRVLLVQSKRSLTLEVADWNALFTLAQSTQTIPVLAGMPTGSGVVYVRLIGKKDGSKRKQPMEVFAP